MARFPADMTLQEARDLLRTLVEEGYRCPCCTQYAKVYRRKIHSRMAADLIKFWQQHRRDWGHTTRTLGASAPDFTKLAYWHLVEARPGEREDGSSRVGWWRVTDTGCAFIRGGAVKSHALIYDGRCLRLDGEPTTIQEALGKKFDYNELMGINRAA